MSLSKTETCCFFKNYLLHGVFLIVVLTGAYWLYSGTLAKASDKVEYFGFTFTIFAILNAANHFKANHDWNRRQLAIVQAKEIREKTMKYIETLDEAFNYVHRKKRDPITVEEIHKKICKMKGGDQFERDKKGKLILDNSDNAKEIRKAIKGLLSYYEYIAAGVHQAVFDEEIIKTIYGGVIVKAYHVFADYIEHFNEDMYPERGGKIWIELKSLAKHFDKTEPQPSKRKKASEQ